jgi:hypothetical protein
MLKLRDLVLEGIGFAQRKKLGKKCIGALLPGSHCLLIGIEPFFTFPNNQNGKRLRCTTS